jgi:hypothetical protein
MKNRPRRPKGVSMSGVRRAEKILAQGDRAFYRQFNSATRRHLKGVDYVR